MKNLIESEGEYPPFTLNRDPDGKRWIISGSYDDLLDLGVNGDMRCEDVGYSLNVGPLVFKRSAASAISKKHSEHLKELPMMERLSDLELPEVKGLTFEKTKQPLIKISGKDILIYKKFIKFRSTKSRLKLDAFDKKHCWIVKLDDLPGLLESILDVSDRVQRVRSRVFTPVRDMHCWLDYDGRYAAQGEIVHLLQWTFPEARHPDVSWNNHCGGVWKFDIDSADKVDAWFATIEDFIKDAKIICASSQADQLAKNLVMHFGGVKTKLSVSLEYESPWLKLKTPYIEGLNDKLKYNGWCWSPKARSWSIRMDTKPDKATDDVLYVIWVLEEFLSPEGNRPPREGRV